MKLLNLASIIVYNGVAVSVVNIEGVNAYWFRDDAARVPPESTNASESLRYLLLMFLIKILAEIASRSHIPWYEVLFMRMEPEMFRAVRFSDLMPF